MHVCVTSLTDAAMAMDTVASSFEALAKILGGRGPRS
jgi:hypothetical protein